MVCIFAVVAFTVMVESLLEKLEHDLSFRDAHYKVIRSD